MLINKWHLYASVGIPVVAVFAVENTGTRI